MHFALWHHRRVLFFICIALVCFLYLGHIGSYHLIELDEGRYTRIPMEMVLSGDYITPHLDYMPYFEKPIFHYWVTALMMELFGIQEFTGRILPALTGLGNVFLAGWLGSMMFGRRTGLLAAGILATTALNLIISSIGILDMALTFFVNACLVSFYAFERTERKRFLLLFYFSMGCAVLTKGLIGAIFPLGILFWYTILTKRWRLFTRLFYVPGIVLFLVVTVPWYYLVCRENPDFFYFFFIREHFLRFATKMHERFQPWYFFIPVVLAGMMPWTGFLAALCSKHGIIRKIDSLRNRQDMILLLLWFGLIYVFYTFSSSKLAPYIMPCWLPMAVLTAASIQRCRQEKTWLCHCFLINSLLCLSFGALGIVYILHTDYLTVDGFLHQGMILIIALWAGTIVAAFVWKRKRDVIAVSVILCCMGFFFGLGAHQIQGQIHNNQSAYGISQQANALDPQTAKLVNYGSFCPGLMYYTNQPVIACGYQGELEFGIAHSPSKDLYMDEEQLKEQWNSSERLIIVLKTMYLDTCLDVLGTPPAQMIQDGKYTLLTNR